MSYCTVEQIKRLLADLDYLLDVPDASPDEAIAQAQAWMDAYLEAAGLSVPLVTAPAFIAASCANYACYLLVRRKNRAGEFTDLMEDFRNEAYRLKDDYLKGLADTPGEFATREDLPVPTVVTWED